MTLYRKYRPERFADLLGQSNAVRLLQQAIIQERIAHAYLFSGPRGTGKTSSARLFAQAVCCQNPLHTKATAKEPSKVEPCGKCSHCLMVLEQSAPDLIEIDAASNRGVEDIRSLREQVQYPPSLLPKKIFIIDEAHMLTGDAFNAFLKTLEEPPLHCLFILATTELHKVPLTVRSRCQIVRFVKGQDEAIQTKLTKIIQKEGWEVDPGVVDLIATHAEGGFRDAETILEQLYTREHPLTLNGVVAALGTQPLALLKQLTHAVLEQNQTETEQLLTSQFAKEELRHDLILSDLINYVRSLPASTIRNQFLEELLEAYILQKSSPVPALPLELACWKTLHDSTVVATNISPATTQLKSPGPGGNFVKTPANSGPIAEDVHDFISDHNTLTVNVKPQISPPKTTVPVIEIHPEASGQNPANNQPSNDPLPDWRKHWRSLYQDLAPDHLPLAQLIKQCTVHKISPNSLTIRTKYRFHIDKLNDRKIKRLLEERLEKLGGLKVDLLYEIDGSLPTKKSARLTEGMDTTPSSPVESVSPEIAAQVFQTNP